MNWISVNERLPKLNDNVLIYYRKNKEFVITQGFLTDEAINLARPSHPEEFWRKHNRGLTWYDYQRQIQSLTAKNSKNEVTHWQLLPKAPTTTTNKEK